MKRSSSFARRLYVPAPVAPLRPIESRGVMSMSSQSVVAVPKGIKAKPGKRTPTALEERWLAAIVAHGCIACKIDIPNAPTWQTPAVHHIVVGGRRLGHLFTLPLCDPGHHQGGYALGLTSRHPWKARFEAKYGTEFELLARLKQELGVFDRAEYTA
jgi:hypothetical protein